MSGNAATMASSNEAPPDHMINFGCGHPDASLLPIHEIANATQQALMTNGKKWLQYGRENGNLPARQVLANFLTTLYNDGEQEEKDVVHPDTLCFTSGVSHGVQLTCRALLRMHSNKQQQEDATPAPAPAPAPPLCWVEDPTYFLIPPIFQQSGYQLEAVKTNSDSGLDLTDLQRKIQAAREVAPNRLLVLYTIPIHHNPLGVSLNQDTRNQLVEICDSNQVYLIADEVYHGLSFPADNDHTFLKPLGMQKKKSPYIISCSAFTKILCPGIRCGWIQTTNIELLRRIGQDGVLDSGGCSSQMSSGIVTQLIQSGVLAQYMTSLQKEYAKRCHHLCELLQQQNASTKSSYQFQFAIPKGGYFLWVQVTGIDFAIDETFRSYCRNHHDVDFKTGLSCSQATWQTKVESPDRQHKFLNCMRLCFAYYDTESLTQGVERLCRAIETYPSAKL